MNIHPCCGTRLKNFSFIKGPRKFLTPCLRTQCCSIKPLVSPVSSHPPSLLVAERPCTVHRIKPSMSTRVPLLGITLRRLKARLSSTISNFGVVCPHLSTSSTLDNYLRSICSGVHASRKAYREK
jgi:hypothetical protein